MTQKPELEALSKECAAQQQKHASERERRKQELQEHEGRGGAA